MIGKLKVLLIMIIIMIVLFFSQWGPKNLHSQENNTLHLRGSIRDLLGDKIGYARLEITTITAGETGSSIDADTGKDLPGEKFVTYADISGNWQAAFPAGETLEIKVSANGYETLSEMIHAAELTQNRAAPAPSGETGNFITDRQNRETYSFRKPSQCIITKTGEVVLSLKEGLTHIRRGSIEHMQLYVSPARQKMLHDLIGSGEKGAVDRYLESGIKPELKKYAYALAGYIQFENSRHEEAKTYFEKTGSKLWFNLMGHFFLDKGLYEKALSYYSQGITTKKRADDLFFLAREFEKQGHKENAVTCYQMALDDYTVMLKSLKYKWDKEYINKSIFCRLKLGKNPPAAGEKKVKQEQLEAILKKAADYCKKLNETAIYYFCHEDKKDHVYLIGDLARALGNPPVFFRKFSPIKLRSRKIVDYYKYDLQFIKKENGTMTENRRLLSEKLATGNPEIPVMSYTIQKPLYGPHTLIGAGWQNHFDYRITAAEKIFKREALVVEATPKWSSEINKMFGKIWVDQKSGAVLKIEWHHRRVKNKEQIRAIGLILDREPEFKFISEFGLKRGGLWYPSRCSIIESYSHEAAKPFVRLKIDIDYKNYSFFVVDETVKVDEDLY